MMAHTCHQLKNAVEKQYGGEMRPAAMDAPDQFAGVPYEVFYHRYDLRRRAIELTQQGKRVVLVEG